MKIIFQAENINTFIEKDNNPVKSFTDLLLQSINPTAKELLQKIALPTLALCGADDMRAELMREQAEYFTGVYEYLEIPEAGHFLHREQSQTINQAWIEWRAKTF